MRRGYWKCGGLGLWLTEHSPRCGLRKALILSLLADLECTRDQRVTGQVGKNYLSSDVQYM